MHKCRAPARRRAWVHDPTGIKIEPRMGLIPFGPRSGRQLRIDHGKHGQITERAACDSVRFPCLPWFQTAEPPLTRSLQRHTPFVWFVWFVDESLAAGDQAPAALIAASISSSVW